MKYSFPLVILMWVYLLLPSLLLNELCTGAVIRDFNRLYGIDVHKVESRMSELMLLYGHLVGPGMTTGLWSFLTIHMLLTPLRLVLVLQYLINPSLMMVNTLVSRHDKSFTVHLLEPAIKRCLKWTLLYVQYK